MRVLHSAALLRPSQGMLNQMVWEQRAAKQSGIPWDTCMYCPEGWQGPEEVLVYSDFVKHGTDKAIFGKALDWLVLRYRYYQWLLALESQYDVFVLRYYVHDPFQLYFLKKVKKPVFFVHHTLEVPELAMPGKLLDKIRSILEKTIGANTLGYATGLVGVTREILDYEKCRAKFKGVDQSGLIYPNGIDCSDICIEDRRGKTIELLFVSSFFSPWHGLDLLIETLKNSNENFVLHIVGDVSETDLEYLLSDSRVILHGKLNHDEITDLSAKCHCGLASFALYRNSMKEACTLKVREYLMLGLPVYSGYHDIFPDDFAYYKMGNADMNEILEYAGQVAGISKMEVSRAARKYIDKTVLLGNFYKTNHK